MTEASLAGAASAVLVSLSPAQLALAPALQHQVRKQIAACHLSAVFGTDILLNFMYISFRDHFFVCTYILKLSLVIFKKIFFCEMANPILGTDADRQTNLCWTFNRDLRIPSGHPDVAYIGDTE